MCSCDPGTSGEARMGTLAHLRPKGKKGTLAYLRPKHKQGTLAYPRLEALQAPAGKKQRSHHPSPAPPQEIQQTLLNLQVRLLHLNHTARRRQSQITAT